MIGQKATSLRSLRTAASLKLDYADDTGSRTLIEVEGGIYIAGGGRHNRAAGFLADLEKYLKAALAGWRVVRLAEPLIIAPMVERLIAFVRGGGCKVGVRLRLNLTPLEARISARRPHGGVLSRSFAKRRGFCLFGRGAARVRDTKRCKVRKTAPHGIEVIVAQTKWKALARKRLLCLRSAMDEFCLFRRALPPSEIRALYPSDKAPPLSGAVR